MNVDLINDKINLILNDKIQNDKIMYNNKIQITIYIDRSNVVVFY